MIVGVVAVFVNGVAVVVGVGVVVAVVGVVGVVAVIGFVVAVFFAIIVVVDNVDVIIVFIVFIVDHKNIFIHPCDHLVTPTLPSEQTYPVDSIFSSLPNVPVR